MSRTCEALQDQLPLFQTIVRPADVPIEVVDLFETLALQIKAQGFDRYSARALAHRIRWHYHVDRGIRDFKFNNNWTPGLARWFMARHPELPDFFETRRSPNSEEDS
jgi:hypothetical protein